MTQNRWSVSSLLTDIERYATCNRVHFLRRSPASESDIKTAEARCNASMPQCIRELLLYSNGVELAGLKLLPADKLFVLRPSIRKIGSFLIFQSWNRHDHDGIVMNEPIKKGATIAKPENIVHVHRDAKKFAIVSPDMVDWLISVKYELSQKGEVRHPKKFLSEKPGARRGMYVMSTFLYN